MTIPTPTAERYVLPVFKTRSNNIRYRWYIEYRVWNAELQVKIRQIKYCPTRYKTPAERRTWAAPILKQITRLLLDGYYQLAPATPALPDQTITPPALPTNTAETITVINALIEVVDLKFLTNKNRTATTYRNVQYRVEAYLIYSDLSNLLLKDFSRRYIYGFSDYLIQIKRNSTVYRNGLIGHLTTLLNELIQREQLTENPTKGVRMLPELVTRTNMAYTAEQRATLETHMQQQDVEMYRYTRFVYQAFIRPKEIMGIQVRDVDLDNNRIGVHGSIAKGTKQNVKTEYVELTPALREIITDMNLLTLKPTDFLFSRRFLPGPVAIHRNEATNRHRALLEATGLYNGELTLYSWKHTGVVNAYRAGAEIEWLQKQLRHSSLEQTVVYLKSLGLMLTQKTNIPSW